MSNELFHRQGQFWMQVAVHSEPVKLHWSEGILTGEPDLASRVERVAAEQGANPCDPIAALDCLELAVAMRPEVRCGD